MGIVVFSLLSFLSHTTVHTENNHEISLSKRCYHDIRVKKSQIVSYFILFFRADDDFESFDVAENIEPNDFAPSDRAENIDLIDRPDSDLNEANEIVSPAIEPENTLYDFMRMTRRHIDDHMIHDILIPSRFRLCRGDAIISGSACGSSGPIDRRAVCGVLFAFS